MTPKPFFEPGSHLFLPGLFSQPLFSLCRTSIFLRCMNLRVSWEPSSVQFAGSSICILFLWVSIHIVGGDVGGDVGGGLFILLGNLPGSVDRFVSTGGSGGVCASPCHLIAVTKQGKAHGGRKDYGRSQEAGEKELIKRKTAGSFEKFFRNCLLF